MALTQVASGLIASVSGASLTGTQNIPKATLPTGSVLQIVNSSTTTQTTTTSTSLISTPLTATITPTSATSKILVNYVVNGAFVNGGANNMETALYKNGSSINNKVGEIFTNTSGGAVIACVGNTYLDSPATTSATTYTIYFKSAGGGSVAVQQDSELSTITLMEISA